MHYSTLRERFLSLSLSKLYGLMGCYCIQWNILHWYDFILILKFCLIQPLEVPSSVLLPYYFLRISFLFSFGWRSCRLILYSHCLGFSFYLRSPDFLLWRVIYLETKISLLLSFSKSWSLYRYTHFDIILSIFVIIYKYYYIIGPWLSPVCLPPKKERRKQAHCWYWKDSCFSFPFVVLIKQGLQGH